MQETLPWRVPCPVSVCPLSNAQGAQASIAMATCPARQPRDRSAAQPGAVTTPGHGQDTGALQGRG